MYLSPSHMLLKWEVFHLSVKICSQQQYNSSRERSPWKSSNCAYRETLTNCLWHQSNLPFLHYSLKPGNQKIVKTSPCCQSPLLRSVPGLCLSASMQSKCLCSPGCCTATASEHQAERRSRVLSCALQMTLFHQASEHQGIMKLR